MYPLPAQCPVCGDQLAVTRLNCYTCGTTIEGSFTLSRIAGLTGEQLEFVETFIRCEGTIKRVERELGISYPTVRARLKDVIKAMGFEVVSELEADALTEEDRNAILDRLSKGEITSEEALALLKGE